MPKPPNTGGSGSSGSIGAPAAWPMPPMQPAAEAEAATEALRRWEEMQLHVIEPLQPPAEIDADALSAAEPPADDMAAANPQSDALTPSAPQPQATPAYFAMNSVSDVVSATGVASSLGSWDCCSFPVLPENAWTQDQVNEALPPFRSFTSAGWASTGGSQTPWAADAESCDGTVVDAQSSDWQTPQASSLAMASHLSLPSTEPAYQPGASPALRPGLNRLNLDPELPQQPQASPVQLTTSTDDPFGVGKGRKQNIPVMTAGSACSNAAFGWRGQESVFFSG